MKQVLIYLFGEYERIEGFIKLDDMIKI
jgi:hypothetical protein